jgi:Carboxypeptidase regulatory-like domain
VRLLGVAVCVMALASALAPSTSAQEQQDPPQTGTIVGVVLSPTGGPIIGAEVVVSGNAGDESAGTDDQGRYAVSGLNAGVYDVTISADGFKTFHQENVVLGEGAKAEVSAKLEAAGDQDSPQQLTSSPAQDAMLPDLCLRPRRFLGAAGERSHN